MSIIEFIPGFSRRNAGGVLLFQTRFAFFQLMQERAQLYTHADYTVDTSELSPLQVVDNIVRFLRGRGVLHA